MGINAAPYEQSGSGMADPPRTIKSSADFTRGSGAAAPDHDADYASRTKRVEAEQRRLIKWAKETGN